MSGVFTITRRLVVGTRLLPQESKNNFFDTFLMLAFIPGQEDLEHRELYHVKKRVTEDSISAGWGKAA